ncbi:type 4a pilus biogenesis protein PilO [Sporomusa malonica]|uniref:Type IV pilus assembly protein PilO n=1 Tax=Sporomusa malonica TaxID=112901 RepID=A0A1W2E9N9_9FIRM|nr:type 4a pilus biogenesis protein PilO [Sporomusa malonica]SMD06503.1 type IV pilus assembly protein PilO [Sporomusa malonica]
MNISWTKLSIKHKSMVFAGGLLITFWLYYFYIIEGQNQRLADLTAQLQVEKQKLAIIQGFSRNHPDPATYLAELGKKSVQAEAMLPNQPDLGGLLSQIEQATKTCGLQLVEIKPASPLAKAGYREIPVEINIKGSFAQTADLLKKLEDIPRFNSLNHVIMNSRQGLLESKLVLIVYSFGVPAGTAGDKQAQTGQTDKK